MPLAYIKYQGPHNILGLWHLTEDESFFRPSVDLLVADPKNLESIHHAKRRTEWLAGRYLVMELARRINLRFVGIWTDEHNKPHLIANNAKVRARMVESFDEKTQSQIDNWVLTLLDKHTLASDKYFKYLIQTILSLGKAGKAVIIGRGANYIMSSEHALKLKIIAPLETRIQNIVEKKGVSRQEAERIIDVVDRDRLAFNRRFFHKDGDEPLEYDLLINSGNMDLATAEAVVCEAVKHKFDLG